MIVYLAPQGAFSLSASVYLAALQGTLPIRLRMFVRNAHWGNILRMGAASLSSLMVFIVLLGLEELFLVTPAAKHALAQLTTNVLLAIQQVPKLAQNASLNAKRANI